MNLLPWSHPLKVIACTFHSVAITCTIFRLVYRWYIACLWWDDAWAAFALAVDLPCLVSALLRAPVTAQEMPRIDKIANWIASLGFTYVLWASRTSILFSILRVANPSQQLRRVACLVGGSFCVMWAALFGQRIQICLTNNCLFAGSVGVSNLVTDVTSDSMLVILPIYLLQRTNISRRQRIMVYLAFSASLLISVVSIFHSVVLFTEQSNGIIVISYVKTALSLIVCNLLVIVAFTYRVFLRRSDLDAVSFTSVDLNVGLAESATDKCTGLDARQSMMDNSVSLDGRQKPAKREELPVGSRRT